MNSLLKSVKSMTNKKNYIVKESLRKQLNAIVMELQGVEGINEGISLGNYEEAMSLCSVLEAIFLHGLKDSLLNRVTEVLSGPDVDAMPQPSFWGPLLVFSHRQIIDQIQSLKQITTEVGYCRAWIRVALNEGLLSSYLTSIQRDNSALKPYYDRGAFIRDSDNIEIARRLIESLDNIVFDLACNTSLLNFWSSTPLLMAAIWSPPMKSCPVFSAVDIAKTINSEMTQQNDNFNDVETASSIGSVGSFSSQTILNNFNSLSEDEALRIILANKEEMKINSSNAEGESSQQPILREKKEKMKKNSEQVQTEEIKTSIIEINETTDLNQKVELVDKITDDKNDTEEIQSIDMPVSSGNSLIGKLGWSTSLDESENFITSAADRPRTSGEGPTYDALIKSYHADGYTNLPSIEDFLKKYAPEDSIEQDKEEDLEPKLNIIVDPLEAQIGKLPREKGLDAQNYSCFECKHPVGMTFSKAHVCSFSGNYYCNNCMASEEFPIPSRIIHNWDMKHYPVSQKNAIYLTNSSALLDLKILNPRIYKAVENMAQLQILRMQLNLLRVYLFTCREPIFQSFQKKVLDREYLYEHVHQYSVADLLDVPSGTLAQQLQKIVEFARNHVLNCWLCSQKGFICEVCNDPKIIYSFDFDSTFRCTECNAVFHSKCLSTNEPCPKCERRRKRMNLHVTETDVDQESSIIIKSQ